MKKKRSVHLRRIRQRSQNKFYRKNIINFKVFLAKYFRKKNKNISLCSFLLCFKGINIFRIFKMFKIFGLNKYYRLKNYDVNLEEFFLIFKKKYNYLRLKPLIKLKNVNKKRGLFLHVSYRHLLRLPVRGQRTKTNAKTRKHYAII